jgi:dTDP-4-amino-4,6-dideoxy-D-galactose acyltransferase
MGVVASELVAARTEKLFYYSPYAGLRALDKARQQELFGTGRALLFTSLPDQHVFDVEAPSGLIQFLYKFLAWDTDFFGAPTYKLFTVLYAPSVRLEELTEAAQVFESQFYHYEKFYCFAELPTEDNKLLQALTRAGWRLVESRLTYFYDAVSTFQHVRYPIRSVRKTEAAHIGEIASSARNEYDRFHADSWFGAVTADNFLAHYASATVLGYCDEVLVPDEAELPLDSFLAISDLEADAANLGCGLSRVVLTAVGSANRGWHLKLVAETIQRAQQFDKQYVLMTTQATNRAVFRTCEKLGFKLGGCSQVIACSK